MKRVFDVLASFLALIILWPLLLGLSALVRVNLGAPILFCQQRPGLNGRIFLMIKFRTMRDAVDKFGEALPDKMRLTRIGKFLRSTSLDELPELWNVLKGDMSLVGPRPLLPEYLSLYTQEQLRRQTVLPGMTGWAQINGRNLLSWEERFKLDLWYVDNQSFFLDMKIILLTIKKVMLRQGVSAEGDVTMPRFTGSKK